MKPNQDSNDIEALARAWDVQAGDIRERVAAAIGAPVGEHTIVRELLSALIAVKTEVSELRRSTESLQGEVFRLRLELDRQAPSSSRRISPYSGADSHIRIS